MISLRQGQDIPGAGPRVPRRAARCPWPWVLCPGTPLTTDAVESRRLTTFMWISSPSGLFSSFITSLTVSHLQSTSWMETM
jgi:hypothetical protein